MNFDGEYAPSPYDRARNQVEEYESSGGTRGTTNQGKPVVILTTRGARTGKVRKTPLMRVEHLGQYAVVASKGGAPEHPVWFHNIKKHPEVQLQDGPAKADYVARELDGDEREEWWDRAIDVWPDYVNYTKRTDRLIPVFVLEPVA